ncbi:MBL fold metallo-hydrolase [Patescibacteria group bacterium]
MKIEKLIVGQLQANCYLVWDESSQEGIIIDPGDSPDFILNKIRDLGIRPKMIVATHGHFDHLLAVNPLKIRFQIPFLLHKNDYFLVERMNKSAQYFLGNNLNFSPPPDVDRFIEEGDKIEFGSEKLKVIETPGHSPGGVALYSKEEGQGLIFSGDTLFKQGVGRTDFSYASLNELKESLEKLFKLPGGTIVYSGHGSETTIGEEKKVLESGFLEKQVM